MFISIRRGFAYLLFERHSAGVATTLNNVTSVRNYSKIKKEAIRLTSEKAQAKHFVDFKKIRAVGGKGGNGGMSFLSIFAKEFAGPDGGNGGNGGHIVFQANPSVVSLSNVLPHYIGNEGGKGASKHCYGKNAESTFVQVPCGTFFRDNDGQLIADLKEPGDMFLAARGGAGGKGNYFFMSNENREPRTFEKGGQGEEKFIHAEIRVIAHIGLLGLPNAGKSSLLRCLTRATPKIGVYPFTTLFPHVGVMEFDDYEQIRLADIPGLIEGAHKNEGLGFSFLRHVEKCPGLAYVIDLSFDNVLYQLNMLKNEIDLFCPGLASKPHVVIGNKIDLEMSKKNYEVLEKSLEGTGSKLIPISAKKKINIKEITDHFRLMYDTIPEIQEVNKLVD